MANHKLAGTDRTASHYDDGLVIFGVTCRDGSFMPAHRKPSRTYKTQAGAMKAINKWITTGR